jgi:hypothetical protein
MRIISGVVFLSLSSELPAQSYKFHLDLFFFACHQLSHPYSYGRIILFLYVLCSSKIVLGGSLSAKAAAAAAVTQHKSRVQPAKAKK